MFGLRQLSEESYSARTATNSVSLGERMAAGGKEYLYVYNGSSNESIDVGRGCKYASQSTGYTVDCAVATPATLTVDACVGVVENASIPTSYYGWLTVRGHNVDCLNKISAVVTGEVCYMSTSGFFQRYSATTVADLIQNAWVGKVIVGGTTTTATATFQANINCLCNL